MPQAKVKSWFEGSHLLIHFALDRLVPKTKEASWSLRRTEDGCYSLC